MYDEKIKNQVKQAEDSLRNDKAIATDEDVIETNKYIKIAKGIKALATAIRKEHTIPLDQQKADLMQQEKNLLAALDVLIDIKNNNIVNFLKIQAEARNKAADEIRAKAENTVHENSSIEDITQAQITAEKEIALLGKPAAGRLVRKFEVLNPSAIPLEYWSPDPIKIEQAVKSGVLSIPGVRIFDEPINVAK